MTLAEKIVVARKSKGFSQEELAERAKVSLRTIQRIEKGESTPRGYTLQVLAEALVVPVEELSAFTNGATSDTGETIATEKGIAESEVATNLQLINLSSLAYLVFPYLNIILPIVLWRRKRHIPLVDEVGRKVINFQILWTVALHVAILLMLLFQLVTAHYLKVKPGPGILAVFFIMYLLNAPAILVASSKLRKGNYSIYPFRFNLF